MRELQRLIHVPPALLTFLLKKKLHRRQDAALIIYTVLNSTAEVRFLQRVRRPWFDSCIDRRVSSDLELE